MKGEKNFICLIVGNKTASVTQKCDDINFLSLN